MSAGTLSPDTVATWRGPRSIRSPKVEVRSSAERGRAIHAKEPIAKGEMVFIKGGHLVPAEVAHHVDTTIGDFSMQVSDDWFLAPLTADEVQSVVVFFNHSCNPNVGPSGQIEFVALRDIAADEELCTDYAMTVDTSNRHPYTLTCGCNSSLCRTTITGMDWQRADLQARYGEHFAPFIKRKIQAMRRTEVG